MAGATYGHRGDLFFRKGAQEPHLINITQDINSEWNDNVLFLELVIMTATRYK